MICKINVMDTQSDNVVTLLKDHAENCGDKIALIVENESLSYLDLWIHIQRVSEGLSQLGLQAGDRVIVMQGMSIKLYIILLAILKIGAIAVFVDPWVSIKQMAAFASFAKPRAFIGQNKSHLLRLFNSSLRQVEIAITTGHSFLGLPAKIKLAKLQQSKLNPSIYPSEKNDTALITFTTGSSGLPKGANRTHGFLIEQHLALKHTFPFDNQDIDITMFPIFALNNLASGITTVIPKINFKKVAELNAPLIIQQMIKHQVTTGTASPPFWDRISHYCQTTPQNKLVLKRIITGGAPVNNQQLQFWQSVFPESEIIIAYGSTEAEPVAHITAHEKINIKHTLYSFPGYCMGKIIPSCQAKIIKIKKHPIDLAELNWSDITLTTGQIGELIVCGNHIGRDYYHNSDAVKENKIIDGDTVWHRMGDTGYFDELERFWLVGRMHSTILRDNIAYHAQQIEQALKMENIQLAAIGKTCDKLGEEIILIVQHQFDPVLKDKFTTLIEQHDLIIDDIIFYSKPFPMDPRHNSKIDYKKLKLQVLK